MNICATLFTNNSKHTCHHGHGCAVCRPTESLMEPVYCHIAKISRWNSITQWPCSSPHDSTSRRGLQMGQWPCPSWRCHRRRAGEHSHSFTCAPLHNPGASQHEAVSPELHTGCSEWLLLPGYQYCAGSSSPLQARNTL